MLVYINLMKQGIRAEGTGKSFKEAVTRTVELGPARLSYFAKP